MNIFPAIDLFDGQAVRLYKGDYKQMTVYGNNPVSVANKFVEAGAKFVHLVDLQGAKTGKAVNSKTIKSIKESSGLFCQTGGGIRNEAVISDYLEAGIDRVILGTSAAKNLDWLKQMVGKYSSKIAVGVDLDNDYVAINGWLEKSNYKRDEYFALLQDIGVKTVICTDISKDGAMQGTNYQLYQDIMNKFDIDIIASGGVSSIDDVKKLSKLNLYGAIIGKAYYTGAIDLKNAIEVA